MGKLIDKIEAKFAEQGLDQRKSEARQWLLQTLKKVSRIDRKNQIINDPSHQFQTNTNFVRLYGRMFFFFYNPKTKDDLPYYDRFPLVIPFKRYDDGFLGLNLHYLPPRYRLIFLDRLYMVLNNHEYDETTKFKLTYKILESNAKLRYFEPCLKRYLRSHIKSKMVIVEPEQWEIAAVLPAEFFAKKQAINVFKESMSIINGI